MDHAKLFNIAVTQPLILRDAKGYTHPVAAADRAADAILLSDTLHELGGTASAHPFAQSGDYGAVDGAHEPLLVFYGPVQGVHAELETIIDVIARCEVSLPDDGYRSNTSIRGARAVVHPRVMQPGATSIPVLVSRRVWYNENRSVPRFPARFDENEAFLDDINNRLAVRIPGCGAVSLPR